MVALASGGCGDSTDAGATDTGTGGDTGQPNAGLDADIDASNGVDPNAEDAGGGPPDATEPPPGLTVAGPLSPQRDGDPGIGFQTLVTEGYVECGMPRGVYDEMASFPGWQLLVGLPASGAPIEGRDGINEGLPYYLTAWEHESGVQLVSTNCLTCHAASIGDELVIGLGNANLDFTFDASSATHALDWLMPDDASDAEWEQLHRWTSRVAATAPAVRTNTVGVNPADNLAAFLFGHRDPETLAWSDEWLQEPPSLGVIPLAVPPWWWMGKKEAMFFSGSGRGDHARLMMSASLLCTDTVESAVAIDALFPDVATYINDIEAPPHPGPIDLEAAERGESLFEPMCAGCHGSYGEIETYPHWIVDLDVVGTDPMLSLFVQKYANNYVDFWENSFYGETTEMLETGGYVAPPLDGVWATGPYFHNDSVPTLEGVLDSSSRPLYWTRSFNSNAYDPDLPGYPYTELPSGKDAPGELEPRHIYDTTRAGYSNAGHKFGDSLTPDERRDLIEYLKSL